MANRLQSCTGEQSKNVTQNIVNIEKLQSTSSSNVFLNKKPFVIESAQKIVIIENVKCDSFNI